MPMAALGCLEELFGHPLASFVITAAGQLLANPFQCHYQVRSRSAIEVRHDATSSEATKQRDERSIRLLREVDEIGAAPVKSDGENSRGIAHRAAEIRCGGPPNLGSF
jgi:hypothetical protein